MGSTTALEKTRLRVKIRQALTDIPFSQMRQSDQSMFQTLLDLPQTARARTISLFWGVTGLEPDTSRLIPELLKLDKRVCLPRIIPDFGMELRLYTPGCPMAPASFGIREPTIECPLVPREQVDLVVVPALCYDRQGFRLGYGGGYYDRWLADYAGPTVGMCRQAVLLDCVPREDHDKPVQTVITEEQVLTF